MGMICYMHNKKIYGINPGKINDFGKEAFIGSYSIPESLSEAIYNSIARIEFEINGQNKISTGFFMKIEINKKHNFFFTCYHSITQENIDSKKNINIYYGKSNNETKINIKLDKNERIIKCFEELDTTAIEILNIDKIQDNKYLFPDLNYQNGIDQYNNIQIYLAGYPKNPIFKNERHATSGEIKKIIEDKIYHTCDTRKGSSGSPLIDCRKNIIGIHTGYCKKENLNLGTFIGKIIDEINKEEKNEILSLKKIKEKEKNCQSIKKVKEPEENPDSTINKKKEINNIKFPNENKSKFLNNIPQNNHHQSQPKPQIHQNQISNGTNISAQISINSNPIINPGYAIPYYNGGIYGQNFPYYGPLQSVQEKPINTAISLPPGYKPDYGYCPLGNIAEDFQNF